MTEMSTASRPSVVLEATDSGKPKRGKFYWLCRNSGSKLLAWARTHKNVSVPLALGILWSIFVSRAYWQGAVVYLRVHSPEIIAYAGIIIALRFITKRKLWKTGAAFAALAILFSVATVMMELPPLRYLTLYLRYRSLHAEELATLPETGFERIQPLNSIRILASEAMKEVEQVSDPDYIRVRNEYRWTMAVQPAYPLPRIFGNVKEVLSVSGTAASPNFSGENRIHVRFRVGEDMSLGKHTSIAATRSLGLFRFLNYRPADVKIVQNDQGEWVQLITWVRWRGIIFLWPEFGGVQVIRQTEDTFWNALKSMFVGEGEWVRPKEIGRHPYLLGQNTVPYEVSRYIAQSLRFQGGFFAPFPGYHRGDARVPNLKGDVNDQPFTTYFAFGPPGSPDNKLWHYFALEPYDPLKQGLNTSVFVPADGVGNVRVYRHYKVNEALTGVSAISAKVMESRKEYDWERSRPVEHRPYIHTLDGKIRFFWLTTVVTYKEKNPRDGKQFIAGSTPQVTLTDATYKSVVWVNPHGPTNWPAELRTNLSVVWKSN